MYEFQLYMEVIDKPNEHRPIRCKWLYKRNRVVDEKVDTFKDRLVAYDFTQNEVVYYE